MKSNLVLSSFHAKAVPFRQLLKSIAFLFFYSCFFTFALYAQQPTEEWVRIYNSPDNVPDHFIDMVLDNNGNVYQTGWNVSQTEGNNIVTVKYSNNGNLLWASSYNNNSTSTDISNGMAVDSSGNCFVAGYTGFNLGPYDGILLKYNPLGDTLWTRRLVTNLNDDFTNVAIDQMNNIIVTGRSGDTAVIFKYDQNGNLIWRNQYFESPYLVLAGIINLDSLNNIFICSSKYILSNSFSADFLFRKYDENGNLLWATTYGNPSIVADWMNDFAIDGTGNSYATGFSEVNGRDIITVKLNSSGVFQWAKYYNNFTNASDQGNAIVCDTYGNNIYIAGYTFVNGFSTNYVTIAYKPNGDTQWVRTYNGTGNYQDNANDITIDKLSNVYVTGESYNNNDFDVTTIKYSTSGNQQWLARWSSLANGDDGGSKIIVDNTYNVYVGGIASAIGPNYIDLLAIKYSQPVGITITSNETPVNFALIQNFPNPFNPVTTIRFNIKEPALAVLNIYNSIGVIIKTLVNEKLNSGYFEINWDATNFPSGIYFYTLNVNNLIETKKMIYIK